MQATNPPFIGPESKAGRILDHHNHDSAVP